MAFIIKDRVKEGTSSVGTGVITLSGSVATFTTFNSFMTNGDTTYYAIVHTSSGVDEWEVGLGTWNTGNTLTRTTVLSGSNGTSAVNFSTGTKDVFMTYPASKAVALDASVNLSIPGNLSVTGSVDGVTSIEVDTHLDFQTTTQNKPAHHEGRIFYDAAFGALAVYNDEADITLQVGQEEYIRVKNNTGSTILNGVPIYITGEEGSTPTVALARADGTYNQSQSVGIATHDIETNSIGYITVRGLIADVDTSHLTVGEKVHVAIGASGGTQTASPTYPNYPTEVGICLISSSSGGCIYVYTQTEAFESLRVTNNAHFDSDVTIAGDLTILGNQTIASASNVSIANAWNYFNSGDTIGSLNTAFTGSGLDDASLTGHFTGTSTTNYYVRIDSVGGGTGGVDTFEWSTDNFSTFVAQDVDITGTDQLIHSTDNIAINFNATTGHTLGDVWTGSGSPINVDTGFASNRNTGTSGVGYTHVGIYYDVSTNKWTVFDEYSPEPEGTINVGHSSFSYGTLKAGVFEGSLTGNVTGDLTGNSAGQHNGAVVGNVTGNVSGTSGSTTGNAATATTLATARNIQLTGDVTGTASFNGSNNAVITASVQDDSHAHVISNVDGLQTALNSKAPTSRIITAGNGLTGGGSLTANRTFTVGGGTGVTVNANDIAIGQDVATTASPTFAEVIVKDAAGNFSTNTADARLTLKAGNSTAAELGFANTTSGQFIVRNKLDGDMRFRLETTTKKFRFEDTTGSNTIATINNTGLKIGGGNSGASEALDVVGNVAVTGTVDGRDVSADGTKLDGIETGATADQTAAQILAAIKTVDVNGTAGVNAGTLGGQLPSGVAGVNTIVQRNASGYIYANYYNGTGTFSTSGTASGMGIFTGTNGNDTFGRSYSAAAARTLLNVENGATADQTAAQLLAAIKTVDVNGATGINAGRLDGLGSGSFLRSNAGDTATGLIKLANASTEFGTSTSGSTLKLWGSTAGVSSTLQTTNGNLHVDAHTGGSAVYLNYFRGTGGVHFGSGATGSAAHMSSAGSLTLNGTVDGRNVAADGTKLDGIATGANNYVLPTTLSANIHAANSGNDNGFTFWGTGDAYSIKMGNNQANHGTVTDYSIHHNMGTTAGRGYTFGSSRTAVAASINALTGAAKFNGTVTAPTFSGALSGNATTATNLTAGAKTIAGNLTVGNSTSSNIYMVDTDHGNRRIHCNSNRIGFLNAANGWSAYSDDAGMWHCPTGLGVTGSITVSGTVDGRDVAADGTKLDGIEAGATADQTAAQILAKVKTVDVNGSAGINAGLLDGHALTQLATANTVVERTSSGDINARLFRSEYDSTNAGCEHFMTQVNTGTNNYLRPATLAQVRTQVLSGHISGLAYGPWVTTTNTSNGMNSYVGSVADDNDWLFIKVDVGTYTTGAGTSDNPTITRYRYRKAYRTFT